MLLPPEEVEITEYWAKDEELGIVEEIRYRGQKLTPPLDSLVFRRNMRPGYRRPRSVLEDIGSLLNNALAHDQFARLLLEAGGLPHLYVQTADPDPTPEYIERIKAATDGSVGGRNRSTPIVDANTTISKHGSEAYRYGIP